MNARMTGWDFICQALSPDTGSEAVEALRRAFTGRDEFWPHVVQWADAHLVTPSVWLGLAAKGLSAELPAEPRQYLEAVYQMNLERNRILLDQLDEAIGILNAQGITPLLLKGVAYLKAGVYADPGARILSDLDLLVDAAETRVAYEALKRAGYAAEREGRWTNDRHCPPLIRAGKPAVIEVHWRHFRDRADQILPTPTLRARAIELREGGLRFRVPTPNHAVMASFLHSQVMDRYSDLFIIGLRPIQDLLALDSAYGGRIDWSGIQAMMDVLGEGARFRAHLHAARRVTGRMIAEEIGIGLSERLHYRICRLQIRSETLERFQDRLNSFAAFRLPRTPAPA